MNRRNDRKGKTKKENQRGKGKKREMEGETGRGRDKRRGRVGSGENKNRVRREYNGTEGDKRREDRSAYIVGAEEGEVGGKVKATNQGQDARGIIGVRVKDKYGGKDRERKHNKAGEKKRGS